MESSTIDEINPRHNNKIKNKTKQNKKRNLELSDLSEIPRENGAVPETGNKMFSHDEQFTLKTHRFWSSGSIALNNSGPRKGICEHS